MMMKGMGKSIWSCAECEAKDADMRAVLTSMNQIKTKLNTIEKSQSDQEAERAKVLEGLKTVEEVAKRMGKIEEVQAKQEQKLTKHDEAIKKTTQRQEEDEQRIRKLEEQVKKVDHTGVNLRQCNAVVKEVREIEKRVKNVIVFNVPDSAGEDAEEKKNRDMEKVKSILGEIGISDIVLTDAVRIGKPGGRYPQQLLVTLQSEVERERIISKCRDHEPLKDGVFITRDRTYNQRQEAKLLRSEKENTEGGEEGRGSRGGGGGGSERGRGRPRGRGRGRGGGASRGARGGRINDSESRKRRNSGEVVRVSESEDDSKRQRTEAGGDEGGGGAVGGGGAEGGGEGGGTSDSMLGAVGGEPSF